MKDLSFTVEEGSVFAFLGTNGAGKSTTIACITTILGVDSGEIEVGGVRVGTDDDSIRRMIGVVFQHSLLDPTLTVAENLNDRSAFYGLSAADREARVAELASLIGMRDIMNRPYGQLSGGQKRRADIARALIHTPRILFLDEPTAGLDPQSREDVWRTIHGLRSRTGLTVFLTTHYMEETEEADEVSIIHDGKIVVEGRPADLRTQYSSSILTMTPIDEAAASGLCLARTSVSRVKNGRVGIVVESAQEAFAFLEEHRDLVVDFEFRHGTMDDVFLAVTSDGSRP